MLTWESPMLWMARSASPPSNVYANKRSAVAPAGSGIAGLASNVPEEPEQLLLRYKLLPAVPNTWLESVKVRPRRKSPALGGVPVKPIAVAVPAVGLRIA